MGTEFAKKREEVRGVLVRYRIAPNALEVWELPAGTEKVNVLTQGADRVESSLEVDAIQLVFVGEVSDGVNERGPIGLTADGHREEAGSCPL